MCHWVLFIPIRYTNQNINISLTAAIVYNLIWNFTSVTPMLPPIFIYNNIHLSLVLEDGIRSKCWKIIFSSYDAMQMMLPLEWVKEQSGLCYTISSQLCCVLRLRAEFWTDDRGSLSFIQLSSETVRCFSLNGLLHFTFNNNLVCN